MCFQKQIWQLFPDFFLLLGKPVSVYNCPFTTGRYKFVNICAFHQFHHNFINYGFRTTLTCEHVYVQSAWKYISLSTRRLQVPAYQDGDERRGQGSWTPQERASGFYIILCFALQFQQNFYRWMTRPKFWLKLRLFSREQMFRNRDFFLRPNFLKRKPNASFQRENVQICKFNSV